MSNRWIRRADEMALYGFGPKAMVMIKVCPLCGKCAPATEDHCSSCGETLNKQTLLRVYQQMHPYCPACGMVAPDDALFCPVCGVQLAGMDKRLTSDGSTTEISMHG